MPDPLNLSQTTFSGGGRLLLTNMNLIATLTLPVQADVTLELRYNKLLGKVDGVEELAGLVYVPGTDCSFSSLKSVRGDVSFSNGPQTTISTPQLEKVGGNLLNDVEKIGYPKLIEVGGYLAVSDNVSDDSGTAVRLLRPAQDRRPTLLRQYQYLRSYRYAGIGGDRYGRRSGILQGGGER